MTCICTGSESRLIDCRHSGIGVHNCDHTDDAGLRCMDGIPVVCNLCFAMMPLDINQVVFYGL